MRVAIEQASGEKYRSMTASLTMCALSQAAIDFYTVPHNISRVKEFLRSGTKTIEDNDHQRGSGGSRAETPRPPARLSARGGAGKSAGPAPQRRLCGDLARRSQCGHRD